MRPQATLLLTLTLAAAAGCGSTPTDIDVLISAPGLAISSLTLTAVLADGTPRQRTVAAPTLPGHALILLPDVSQKVTVQLHAVDSKSQVWEIRGEVRALAHKQVALPLTLGPGVATMTGQDMATDGFVSTSDMPELQPALHVLAGVPGGAAEVDDRGTAARFYEPTGLAFVGTTLYVTDMHPHLLRTIDPDGTVKTVALVDESSGLPVKPFDYPSGLAYDGNGHLYVAEWGGCDILRVTLPARTVKTIAGHAQTCEHADGTGDAAHFANPMGLAIDGSGNLWTADTTTFTVRKITPDGTASTVAGLAGSSSIVDGSGGNGGSARFANPDGVVVIGQRVYIADYGAVRMIDLAQAPSSATYVTSVARPGTWGYLTGIAAGDAGSLLAYDGNRVIHRIVPGTPPTLSDVAGGASDSVDGNGSAAGFAGVTLMINDGNGSLYMTDGSSVRTMTVGAPWTVTTRAGQSEHRGTSDAPSRLSRPAGVAWDGANTVYFVDSASGRLRRYDFGTGAVTTLAGNGSGSEKDGTGDQASMNGPVGVAMGAAGTLYVSDHDGNSIRAFDLASRQLTTLVAPSAGDVPPLFNQPQQLVFDGAHTLYVADKNNHRIRTVDTGTKAVGVLAGTGAPGGHDDTGAAATFDQPSGIAFDPVQQRLYVSDTDGQRIRRIDLGDPNHTVTTIAGDGQPGFADGPALQAHFASPMGLALSADGHTLYIADYDNQRVRALDLAAGMVRTVAGDGTQHTLPGTLPGNVSTPLGVVETGHGLVISSNAEDTLLLAD